ncbi:MAG: PTS sugar transporter subunit IIA [Anaerorhabdus sp.]|uniref:PTS sugar transporter subunit IIA n=1 Tax=Anaerorhabdus sp. TaxID=1872524 RepID=UPI003A8B5BBB
MKKLIITGHGKYGSAIKEVIEFIAGDQLNVIYCGFLGNQSEKDLENQYIAIIEESDDEKIFICDIPGATPFRITAMLTKKYNNIYVIGGVNVSAILEIIFHLENLNANEILKELESITKKTVIRFNAKGV